MSYLHTFSIGIMNLILPGVLVVHGQLVQLVSDVVGGAGVSVPVCVHTIGGVRRNCNLLALGVVLGITVVTILRNMVIFLVNLTLVKVFIITLEGTTIVVVVAALVVVVARWL